MKMCKVRSSLPRYKLKQETGSGKKTKSDDDDDDGETLESETRHKNFHYLVSLI